MRKIDTRDLRELEVINLCGGENLGYPCELEIDVDCGKVISIVVISQSRGFSILCEREEYVIPWCRIECIGEDAILVNIPHSELCNYSKQKSRKKRNNCK